MSVMEQHHFQAEIQQLLDIVVHSLYTDKEIFVRELISNAADACEKLRFAQASGKPVYQPETPPAISIVTDESAKTVAFVDAGVGMTHGELVENLGTIAHSGTKAFVKQLAEEKQPDARLIGQFGVGFYSAFMVAGKVEVWSRSYELEAQGWHWVSEGANGYALEPAPDLPRGTKVLLHLKDETFARPAALEPIIKRYSNFVQFPIELNGRRLNTVQAIWARKASEVKEEEYNEFYQYIGHDPDKPLYRLHFTSDAPLAIQSVMFVAARNFENLGLGRTESQVHLYCRKVLIQSQAKGLLPEWLRFLRGVVDSEDLPLNISRESMQDTALLQKLNRALTGRFLKFLEEQASREPALYDTFYAEYQRFLKEGVVTDLAHREALGKLLRYESSALEPGRLTSLADYVSRMPSDQKEIYYLLAPSRAAAESSPYFEVFKARKVEVLFTTDPWDEFVMEHLHAFGEKPIRAAEKAELAVEGVDGAAGLSEEAARELAQWLKSTLGDRVHEVRVSQRLVESPAVIVDSDKHLTSGMRRILKAASKGAEPAAATQDLELNPRHLIVQRLETERRNDPELAVQVAEQLLDNARVAAGLLEDPRAMVKRLNDLLQRLLSRPG